ncbi:hypothetical protein Cob_v002413 [Colletotrichum orbiculare MAFF 240422]|uniref:Uncharacterized protein n=1 Tax=Colletotrichum orbiculare (strain 104-T / ATCC 96160 / CBS 514.97 / LARS 414 / MAFF 240422) TaxID=1213857 RepID=A0A484G3D0_COLOR|nr:hypothetical protein Cob_v002413 [Colletotrichum orbiculare MAFF 240422]
MVPSKRGSEQELFDVVMDECGYLSFETATANSACGKLCIWESQRFPKSALGQSTVLSLLTINMLLWTIIQMTQEWFVSWLALLESLEAETAFQINDLDRPAALEKIMFDHSFHQSTKIHMEDIKGLQDGLFNASSLRETNNGMLMSRAVYAFTIVTIIYTPLGFMATFWALPFLNQNQDGQTMNPPSSFHPSFVLVPLVTYLITAVFALFLASQNFRDAAVIATNYGAIGRRHSVA